MQTKQGPDELYCVGNARTVYLQNGWERYQDARKASLCALIVEADPFQTRLLTPVTDVFVMLWGCS